MVQVHSLGLVFPKCAQADGVGGQDPVTRIIGAYCEYLSAPAQPDAVLERHLACNSWLC